MKMLRVVGIFFVAVFMFLLYGGLVLAEPTGPGAPINPLSSSRYDVSTTGGNVSAIAGNVTEFNIDATTITQTWQGYFGNITGTIVLGNSNNDTLYDWVLSSPQGEIYATRSSTAVTWASIRCANRTEIGTEHTFSGASAGASDRINNTFFNGTTFDSFYVGSVQITSSGDCSATNLYNATGAQTSYFSEVILSDSASVVYVALLESDIAGFDGRTHDFEMIVPEDGHNGNSAITPYYFYVELE